MFQVIGHLYNTDAQTYSAVLDQQLMPGEQYQLYIKFLGHINDNLQGFYRSSYNDPETGQKRLECAYVGSGCNFLWLNVITVTNSYYCIFCHVEETF
jgi:hypothetical protein